MIANTMQHGRTGIAAQDRCDRCQLQLGGDRALCADRRIHELDGEVDGGQKADAGDTTRYPGQEASQRAGGGARRNHDDDFGKSVTALQLDDRLRGTLGNTPARSHPTRGHYAAPPHLDGCFGPLCALMVITLRIIG